MNLKLIVVILVIAAVPVWAKAQAPTNATVTKSHAQNALKIISGDKAKTQAYCDMLKLFQIGQASEKDTKKTNKLLRKMNELAKKLGPEYAALLDGLSNIDPNSQDGQEISSTFEALDKLCKK
jgi:hypothetical protein